MAFVDGCRLVVAPFGAAKTIESEAVDGKAAWIVLRDVHVHDVAGLQCLLAADDPLAPSRPPQTRYSPFMRCDRTLTCVDVLLETWRGFVDGEWHSDAEIVQMAKGGITADLGPIAYVMPKSFVDALCTTHDEPDLAARWGRVYDESFDAAAALRNLVRTARASKDNGTSVFLVELG